MIDSNRHTARPIGKTMMKTTLVVLLLSLVACTKKVDVCHMDSDCSDPAFPFCDVNGEFAASGGDKNVCTIVPPDCPVDRCGCTPGAVTCATDQLTTCNADGMSDTMTPCTLGCGSNAMVCATFTPSNGLATILLGAGSASALAIPAGSTIDTDTGVITGPDGSVVASNSTLLTSGSTMIRAFAAPSFSLPSLKITGANPIAFVATGTIDVQGLIDLSADAATPGPGAAATGAACEGVTVNLLLCSGHPCGPGAGGGGNATQGGAGGADGGPGADGGVGEVGFTLVGGCAGGSAKTGAAGGGGGGAIQLVSATEVDLDGVIHVGGGGGVSNTGAGGSGGLVVIEAPTVALHAMGGIAANGGAGGGCVVNGADATPNPTPALGGSGTCDHSLDGGNGAAGTLPPNPGGNGMTGDVPQVQYGGGGGALGRARIATKDGSVQQDANAIASVALTTEMLVVQ
jgi:hypothetical protein